VYVYFCTRPDDYYSLCNNIRRSSRWLLRLASKLAKIASKKRNKGEFADRVRVKVTVGWLAAGPGRILAHSKRNGAISAADGTGLKAENSSISITPRMHYVVSQPTIFDT